LKDAPVIVLPSSVSCNSVCVEDTFNGFWERIILCTSNEIAILFCLSAVAGIIIPGRVIGFIRCIIPAPAWKMERNEEISNYYSQIFHKNKSISHVLTNWPKTSYSGVVKVVAGVRNGETKGGDVW
jgi:hypothetical protein